MKNVVGSIKITAAAACIAENMPLGSSRVVYMVVNVSISPAFISTFSVFLKRNGKTFRNLSLAPQH